MMILDMFLSKVKANTLLLTETKIELFFFRIPLPEHN